jgi:hypothetical protein
LIVIYEFPFPSEALHKHYNEITADEFFSDYTEVSFYPSHRAGDPYPPDPEYSWIMYAAKDSSHPTIPPQDVLDKLGNPFVPNDELNMPLDGNLYAVIKSANSISNDNLFTDEPKDSLLKTDVKNFIGDTLRLGRKVVGDKVRFYIKSSSAIVSGMKLYPYPITEIPYQTGDGEIYLGTLNFEDWTDLLYNDLSLNVYVHPDTISSFPSPVIVTFNPSEVAPGDTAQINLMERNDDGTITSFDPGQDFDVAIFQGQQYGTLYSPQYDDTADAFQYVHQGFTFIAADSINGDSANVIIKVIAHTGGIIASSVSSAANKTTSTLAEKKNTKTMQQKLAGKVQSTNLNSDTVNTNTGVNKTVATTEDNTGDLIGFGEVKVKEYTIMLGETKYYQAKEDNGKLKIEEVKPGSDGIPHLDGGIASNDVWGNDPVHQVSGDKPGVYWETGKPIWNGNRQIGTLGAGIIRLIGRYWKDNTEYKISLNATNGTEKASIDIEIVNPNKLLSPKQRVAYDTYLGVDSSVVQIDNLCIAEAGKYGLMPQLLKGQIFDEAAKNTGTGVFYPSYRYEPYTTQWDKYLKTWSGRFYFRDLSSADYSDVPNHKNVHYINYIRQPMTVWDVIKGYSQLVNLENSDEYGKQNSDHTMDFYPRSFPWLQNKYESFLKGFQMNPKLTKTQAADKANTKMAQWLQKTWRNGRASNTVAETRCASSYGLLQMLYTKARERGYSKAGLPEDLNKIDLFDEWVKYQADLLSSGVNNSGNWNQGFELTYKTNVLAAWNRSTTYPSTIISFSQMFLPEK